MDAAAQRSVALATGIRLEAASVGWMAAEAVLAIGVGLAARSVLLTAFGFDSVVEVISGAVVWWRLSVEARGLEMARVDRLERRTALVSAVLLALLSAYVVVTALVGLVGRVRPDGSVLGMIVAALALVGMPVLALGKSRANRIIGSASLRADIAETTTCAYMAAATLAGVGLSTVLGLWWCEYIAALALLIWLVPEAREALEAARGRENV